MEIAELLLHMEQQEPIVIEDEDEYQDPPKHRMQRHNKTMFGSIPQEGPEEECQRDINMEYSMQWY